MTDRPPRRPVVSVVVPVYNGAETLPELVTRLEAVLRETGAAFEILLVNDGSRDRSWDVVAALAARDPAVCGIDLMRNYGQQNALLAGIRATSGDLIVTLDDDLQHPPEEIPKLLAELERGFDVVYGAPDLRQHELWRIVASRTARWILGRAIGLSSVQQTSAFRAFRSELRQAFADFSGPSVAIDALLAWGTTRFSTVPVRHEARSVGASTYGARSLAALAVSMLAASSALPLRVASLIGAVGTLIGVSLFVYGLARGPGAPADDSGLRVVLSLLALLSALQCFALAVAGEYLIQLQLRSMGRPPYAVRARTPSADPHGSGRHV